MISEPSFSLAAALPAQPLPRPQQIIDKGFAPIVEDTYAVSGRVTSVFTLVYSTIGETVAVVRIIAGGLETFGDAFDFEQLL